MGRRKGPSPRGGGPSYSHSKSTGDTRRPRTFSAFWYDFVIGDDWRIALGVVARLALTSPMVHSAHVLAWWVLPDQPSSLQGWLSRCGPPLVSHKTEAIYGASLSS
jgi:hypothetical protein